jgi:hypothetical protein
MSSYHGQVIVKRKLSYMGVSFVLRSFLLIMHSLGMPNQVKYLSSLHATLLAFAASSLTHWFWSMLKFLNVMINSSLTSVDH